MPDSSKTKDTAAALMLVRITAFFLFFLLSPLSVYANSHIEKVDFPFSHIYAVSYADGSGGVGSGTFIAPNAILTTVAKLRNQSGLTSFNLYIDKQGISEPVNFVGRHAIAFSANSPQFPVNAVKIYFHPDYGEDLERHNNAIIVLPADQKYMTYDNGTNIAIPSPQNIQSSQFGQTVYGMFYDYESVGGQLHFNVHKKRAILMDCDGKPYFDIGFNPNWDLTCLQLDQNFAHHGNIGGGLFQINGVTHYMLATVGALDVLDSVVADRAWIRNVLMENNISTQVLDSSFSPDPSTNSSDGDNPLGGGTIDTSNGTATGGGVSIFGEVTIFKDTDGKMKVRYDFSFDGTLPEVYYIDGMAAWGSPSNNGDVKALLYEYTFTKSDQSASIIKTIDDDNIDLTRTIWGILQFRYKTGGVWNKMDFASENVLFNP